MAAPHSIAIVATGPSLKVEDVKADIVIAVNAAIKLITPHYWFTLDPSPVNMQRMQNPVPCVQYVAAIPDNRHVPHHVIRMRRVEEDNLSNDKTMGDGEYWMWRWKAKRGLSEDQEAIHTGNSAYGALGLAYHLRPKIIHLHGVDGTQEHRITGGRPRRLDHLPILFASAKPQLDAKGIQVFNHSITSKVTCFPKC